MVNSEVLGSSGSVNPRDEAGVGSSQEVISLESEPYGSYECDINGEDAGCILWG